MMDINQAANMAINTPLGSPAYGAAWDICVLRGKDPIAYEPAFGPQLANWQRVIAEQLLAMTVQIALGRAL
jgi:hypothetical protein